MLHVSVNLYPIIGNMTAMLSDSAVAAFFVRTHPSAISLAVITMRKSTHGFPFLSYMSMGLPLAFGPPELPYYLSITNYFEF